MIWTARIYLRSLGAHIRAVLEYEADFWVLRAGGLLHQVDGLVFLRAVFARVPAINGWGFHETLLVYAFTTFAAGTVPLVADGMWRLAGLIRKGELDYRLTRPYPVILQVLSSSVGLQSFGELTGSTVLIVWALAGMDVHWSPWRVAVALVLFASALVIRIAIGMASNAVVFWLGSANSLFAFSLQSVGDMARYPLTVYSLAFRVGLTVVVPFGFVSFFPAAWLAGYAPAAQWALCAPLVAAYCCAVTVWVFRRGLRRYDSAGH